MVDFRLPRHTVTWDLVQALQATWNCPPPGLHTSQETRNGRQGTCHCACNYDAVLRSNNQPTPAM